MVRINIFVFFIWTLTPMCDLDFSRRDQYFASDTPPHNGEPLCQVILKYLYACRSFAPDKRFSMTSKFDLWPADLIYAHDTASSSDETLYEVSFESLNICRRYALDKISI
jgi:hypothetical protein